MKAFDELRAKAKARRDQAINQARTEYTQTVQDIAGLEMRLAHRRHRSSVPERTV